MGYSLMRGRLALGMMAMLALWCTACAQARPLNILFYGNSYSISPIGVPTLVGKLAVAAGHERPNCENASVATYSLAKHLQENLGRIAAPEDFAAQRGFRWDYVVLQDHSLRATEIPWKGDPQGYKRDVAGLFERVRGHSPRVRAVIFETWARSPMNEADLTAFYPALTEGRSAPFTEASEQMQRELRKHHEDVAKRLGAGTRVALAGEAFMAAGWDGLYDRDLAHPSSRGQLLAAMVVYQAIYGEPVTAISFEKISGQMSLKPYGISDAAAWERFAGYAAGVMERE